MASHRILIGTEFDCSRGVSMWKVLSVEILASPGHLISNDEMPLVQ